jgi:hypothetical protein
VIEIGTYRLVKVTGLDRVGKSTLVDDLNRLGYQSKHFPYRPGDDVFSRYAQVIKSSRGLWAFDRGFITEHVYGPVLRGASRLSDDQVSDLASRFADAGGAVVWVSETAETLRERLADGDPTHLTVANHLERLLARQSEVMERVAAHAPAVQVVPTELGSASILSSHFPLLGWSK